MDPLREDKPLYTASFTALSIFMFLLLISSVLSVNFSFAQTTDGFPPSIIVSSSTNTTPHLLKLKATQQGGAETRISGFSVDTTSAVSAQANSQLLVLVTDSSLRVIEAKVRTASNQVIDLVPVTSSQQATGAFSLAGLPGGVYTLDVITQKGSAKAAYEGVLSIGQQPLTVIEETTKRVTNEYGDLILIFLPPEECPPGTTGIPPNCELIPPPPDCDVDNPPPDCAPTECPDGRIMPPGVPCPDDALPCDDDNLDRPCTVPTECPDGTIIPPGQECPDEEPPDEEPPDEEPPDEEAAANEEPPDEEPPDEEPPDEEAAADEEDASGAN